MSSDRVTPPGLEARSGKQGRIRSFFRFWVADVAFGLVNVLCYRLIRVLPVDVGSAIGGRIAVWVGTKRFWRTGRWVRANYAALATSPPGDAEVDDALARYWDNVGRSLAEFCMLDRLQAAGRIEVRGAEHPDAVRASGRAIIAICVHLGNWEAIGPTLTRLGHNGFNTYLPPENRFQHRIMIRERARYGAVSVLHDARGLRQTYRLMKEGRTNILLYVDEPRDGTVRVPSFGRGPAERGNLASAVRFALLSGGCFVPAFVERGEGARLVVNFLPPMPVVRDPDPGRELAANLSLLDEVLDAVIRPRRAQWLVLKDLRLGC